MNLEWEFLAALFLRWAHVLCALIWMGMLYHVALVQAPGGRRGDKQARARLPLATAPQALWWLRWSSMLALLLGIALFTWEYHRVPGGIGVNSNLELDGHVTDRAFFIMTGIGLALLLWFVSWFLVWPALHRAQRSRSSDETRAAEQLLVAEGHARCSTLLAGPMLLFMIAPQNYLADFNWQTVLALLVSGAILARALLLVAERVGGGEVAG